jgi:hypothetical protein
MRRISVLKVDAENLMRKLSHPEESANVQQNLRVLAQIVAELCYQCSRTQENR